MFNIEKLNKKGMAKVNTAIEVIIGVLIVVTIAVSLVPDIFSGFGGSTGLGNATLNPDAPSWFAPVLLILVAVGLMFLLWRMFSGKK